MAETELESWDDLENYEDMDLQLDYSKNGIQMVTFTLENETYGVDILKVRELISNTHITTLPNMPPFIKGMLNLRGLVIPIIDLRIKFGMPEGNYDQYTVFIIVQLGEKQMGIIVDSVADVVFLPDDQMQTTPELSASVDTTFILGMGRVREELIIVLDIDRILSKQELVLIHEKID